MWSMALPHLTVTVTLTLPKPKLTRSRLLPKPDSFLHVPPFLLGCAGGCVVECRICNREVAGSNLGLGYFAPRSTTQPSIPPGSINEYQLRLGRQRQVRLIPIADERVGVQVKLWKSLENTCHAWALLRWWFTTKRRYIKCMHLYLYLYPSTEFCENRSVNFCAILLTNNQTNWRRR